VETSGGIQASLAGRYASALFGLARDERQIDAVSNSLGLLSQALVDSREFAKLVSSPLVNRPHAGKALAAVAKETPWIAIVGAGLASAANLFLNRNKSGK